MLITVKLVHHFLGSVTNMYKYVFDDPVIETMTWLQQEHVYNC